MSNGPLSPEISIQNHQFSVEHSAGSTVDYTLYRPDVEAGQTIVFYPGMACNRFGHPVEKEPRNAVADLIALAADRYNIIFPEVHMPDACGDTAPIVGLTVEEQNQRIFDVLSHAAKKLELGRVTYVGQSLGCLAVAQIAYFGGVADRERAIFWGPPTLEGKAHKEMLVSKFKHKPQTEVSEEGGGKLELGNGRLMYVSREYWQSMDDNSLRIHHEAMAGRYEDMAGICASRDNFYPNNKQYLAEHAPAVRRLEIEGASHIFRTESMRTELRRLMAVLLRSP